MAKEKLFTPEDFDKPKDKGFWAKYKGLIIGIAILLIIAVILCYIFCGNGKNTVEQVSTEQIVQENDSSVTSDSIKVTDASMKKEVNESITSEQVETESASMLVLESDKSNTASSSSTVSDNIEHEALNVIRGTYGNVPERREKLGSKYQEIQNRVNQLKKEGAF